MSTVILNFEGLILHHKLDDDSRRAIVVATHGKRKHRPVLRIARDTAVIEHDDWRGEVVGDCIEYPLGRRNVTIDNLERGAVTLQPRFKSHVPRLPIVVHRPPNEPLDPDDLHDDVKRGRPHTGVVAYVCYSSGSVGVTSCYQEQGVYTPPHADDPTCFAKIVTFTGATTGPAGTPITLRDNNSNAYITVPDGTKIDIQNICDDGGSDHKEYKKLLKRDSAVLRELNPQGTCSDCAEHQIKGEPRAARDDGARGASIGCSNNQWP
ncbi:MAG TPA: hypothetical protein VE010_23705 [Thermoanaerobaculia bacterium]|nr:hypothetical protein [Thermoanaerobaculia bacterium]